MNPAVKDYINRFKNGEKIEIIDLEDKKITDLEMALLMQVIAETPGAIKKIRELRLSNNYLTTLPPHFSKFEEGPWININGNPLTYASKIALQTLSLRQIIMVNYDDEVPINVALTTSILEQHVNATPANSIEYLKSIGAVCLLAFLPVELVRMLNEMLLPPAVSRLRADMDNFMQIFNLPILAPTHDNLASLEVLNDHIDKLKNDIEKAKKFYNDLLAHNTVRIIAKFHRFIRSNGFNQNNLLQENAKGFTPLALARQRDQITSEISVTNTILRRIENQTEVTPSPRRRKNAIKSTSCCNLS